MEILAQTILIWSCLYIIVRVGYLTYWRFKNNWTLTKQREEEIERFISRLGKQESSHER